MSFTFTVSVALDRESGPFASRDEIGAAIAEAIEQADPGTVETDNGGVYNTVTWDVIDDTPVRR